MQMDQQALTAALAESNKYEHLQTLGKGSFGYVLLARNTESHTGETVAIKLLPRAEVSLFASES